MAIMNRPRITVATVALNAARDLPLTIESILAQTYPDIETLVIDGYSWDDSDAVLARYRDRIGSIVRLEDGGIYQAMNVAAKMAQGDYVLFLNAGDRFYCADAVEALVERMDENADVVYGDHVYVDGRMERFVQAAPFDWLWQKLRDGRIDQHWHGAIPCHQATFTRTRLLRDMPYDTRYGICADHDFLFRARAHGARLQYVDEIVCHYLAGGMSGAQGVRIHREWAHAYRKHSLRPLGVDSFFFGSDQTSPFPSFTQGSGKLQGSVEPEMRAEGGERWRWINGMDLKAPTTCETVGLHLRGASRTGNQMLVITRQNTLLGAEKLAWGGFDQHTAFLAPVAPDEIIRIDAQIPGAIADSASWGIEALHFISCPELAGTYLDLLACDAQLAADVFFDGWHAPEWSAPDGTVRIWSNVEQASFAMTASGTVETLTLHLEGHIGAREGQSLSVVVNGQLAGGARLEAGAGSVTLRVAVGGSWRKGANIVRLCLDRMVYDADQGTAFGFALSRVEWQ
jgi:GT2 family glycosyltransferase